MINFQQFLFISVFICMQSSVLNGIGYASQYKSFTLRYRLATVCSTGCAPLATFWNSAGTWSRAPGRQFDVLELQKHLCHKIPNRWQLELILQVLERRLKLHNRHPFRIGKNSDMATCTSGSSQPQLKMTGIWQSNNAHQQHIKPSAVKLQFFCSAHSVILALSRQKYPRISISSSIKK